MKYVTVTEEYIKRQKLDFAPVGEVLNCRADGSSFFIIFNKPFRDTDVRVNFYCHVVEPKYLIEISEALFLFLS